MRLWPFGPRLTEAERGKKNAEAFLATQPSLEQLNRYWSCAKEDEAFSADDGGGYCKAALAVIRPVWRQRNGLSPL